MKLGFIGLGIMGAPMAGHLLKAGHQLFVHSVPSVPADVVAAGATACSSGRCPTRLGCGGCRCCCAGEKGCTKRRKPLRS